jgi:ectoine hydroxylase-related dioxygenase (phytanoyl-CoA dioxygenase family)
VPGTHALTHEDSAYEGNTRPERAAALVCGPPGSVIVYHGSTWHGYSRNDSDAPRRSVQGAYVPPNGTAALDWRQRVQPATPQRLSPLAKRLLSLA